MTGGEGYFLWPALMPGDKELIYMEDVPNERMMHIKNLKDKTEKLVAQYVRKPHGFIFQWIDEPHTIDKFSLPGNERFDKAWQIFRRNR